MNSVLEEIISTGSTLTVDGNKRKVIGQITKEEGKLIQNCIKELNAEISIEVGLAFGTSALYICEALNKTERTKHYVIDPYQMYEESYGGIGLNNLKKAGYEGIIEFIDKPSHIALTELELKNIKADFAFIDGWHTFDYALVDFFHVDKILRVGGIVIIDDSDWDAIRKVCSFISTNTAYKFIGGSPQRSHLKKNNPKGIFKKISDFFKTDSSVKENLYGAMAFQKTGKDTRSWDHFVNFK